MTIFRQYIGDPIDCIVEEIPANVMDTYCWIHSTFSIPGKVLGIEGDSMAHPGVAPPDDSGYRYIQSNGGDRFYFRLFSSKYKTYLPFSFSTPQLNEATDKTENNIRRRPITQEFYQRVLFVKFGPTNRENTTNGKVKSSIIIYTTL